MGTVSQFKRKGFRDGYGHTYYGYKLRRVLAPEPPSSVIYRAVEFYDRHWYEILAWTAIVALALGLAWEASR